MTDTAYDLERFVTAQAEIYDRALAELRAGEKRSHWMWFIFPQLKPLGRSSTAQFYGIGSRAEAEAYLDHPVLGPRLAACTEAVLAAPASSLLALFGSPDDLKFKSSMTLFEAVAGEAGVVFGHALDRWCGGARDVATLTWLERL